MGKGMIFVIAYSIVLISLFVCFSYLMTTVNPDPIPIVVESRIENDINIDDAIVTRYSTANIAADNENSPTITEDKDTANTFPTNNLVRVPDRIAYIDRRDNIKEDHIDQSNVTYIKEFLKKQIGEFTYILENDENKVEKSNIAAPKSKKENKRSLDDMEADNGAIILRILDDIGRIKFEIVVEADAFERNANTNKSHDPVTNQYCRNYKNKDTVITISPNKSLSLNKCNQSSFVLDFTGKNEVIFKINKQTQKIVRNVSSTSNEIMQLLKNDKLVVYKAVNST